MAKVPRYRKHSTRNLGFVQVDKKRVYFPGKYNSAESLSAYADFVKKFAQKKDTADTGIPDIRSTRGDGVPIRLLAAQFLDWAKTKFVKNGRSTGTYERFRDSIVPPLLEKFGDLPTSKFGPVDLKEIRKEFVKRGLCRNEVNDRTSRAKRIFSWGVGEELVPESVAGALQYVSQLDKGETTARETAPIKAVPDAVIDATLKFLPPTVDDMVDAQRLTGCRPSEICNLRWCDIDQSDDIWIYTPWEHKTEHKKKPRRIAVRPAAQLILEKYRHRPVEEFIFSPRETVRIISERKRIARKTPVQPSQVKRSEKAAKRPPKHNEKYSTRAYELAIDRAVIKYNAAETENAKEQGRRPVLIPAWSPNQIRHAFATETENSVDKETARILLGHSHQSTTEIYLDENIEKVKEAARRIEKKAKAQKKS